jgi:hypothetical protein
MITITHIFLQGGIHQPVQLLLKIVHATKIERKRG